MSNKYLVKVAGLLSNLAKKPVSKIVARNPVEHTVVNMRRNYRPGKWTAAQHQSFLEEMSGHKAKMGSKEFETASVNARALDLRE